MKSCLWVQWKKPTDPSKFVIDGICSEYSATREQGEIIDNMAKVPHFREICNSTNCQGSSPSFRLSYSSEYYCVEGNFQETDVADRNLVYIFLTKEDDAKNRVRILREYSEKLGVTPYPKDLEVMIEKKIKKINFSNLWKVMTTVILLLLFTLLNLLSKQ